MIDPAGILKDKGQEVVYFKEEKYGRDDNEPQ